MVRKWLRRTLLGLVVAVLLGVALVAWRLSRGPVDLAFLVPSIERALGAPDGSLRVEIGAVELAWDPREHDVDLRARDVHVRRSGGDAVASVPLLGLELSGQALLRGVIAPRVIELVGPRLRLVRLPDGGIDLSLGEESADGQVLAPLLARRTPTGDHPGLRRVEVRDGDVLLMDRVTGATWSATGVQIELERADRGIELALTGAVQTSGRAVPVRIEGRYDPEAATVVGTVVFESVTPAALAAALPPWKAVLARFDMPLRGSLELELDASLRARKIRLKVDGDAGSVAVPELPVKQLAITRLHLAGALDLEAAAGTLSEVQVDLGRTTVRAFCRLGGLGGTSRIGGEASISDIPVDDLGRYWPRSAAREARAWVTSNTTGGRIREATVKFGGRLGDGGQPVVEAVSGSLVFDGLTVRYDDAMPAARELAGTATFTPQMWRFHVARGTVGGLELVRAQTSVDLEARRVGIDASGRGSMAAALALARKIGRVQALDVFPAETEGAVVADLQLDIPLLRPRRPGDRDLLLTARLQEVAVPASFRPWLEGRVDGSAELRQQGAVGVLDLGADLASASLRLPPLAIVKSAPAPGSAEARVLLAAGGVTAVDRFSLAVGGTSLAGRATRSKDGRTWEAIDASAILAARDARRAAGRAALALRSEPSGHRFALTSDDAGALLRALGSEADAAGGALRYAGTVDLVAPGLPFDGRLELRDVQVVRAPLLARIATSASLSGLTSALQGKGIAFQRVTGDVAHRDTTLTISDAVATGPSVSILLGGTIDRTAWTAALRGTLVPSYYGLNTAPGRIPVVGKLVTGSGGQGVQAVDFTVSGPLDAPRVSVNPLSSLAPGALRDILRRIPGAGK